MKLNRTGSNWTELERNKINENWSIIEGLGDSIGKVVTGLVWKTPVDSVADLPKEASEGDTRMVREADPDGISYVYRYDGENWEKIQAIDVTLVNEVDRRLTRQLAETNQDVVDLDLVKMDKGTTNISVNQINKNLGKLDESFMADEFLQQMAGNTPVHAIPPNEGVTNEKIAPKAIESKHLISQLENKLFISFSDWVIGNITSNGGEGSSPIRIKTSSIKRLRKGTVVEITDPDYSFQFHGYELDGTFIPPSQSHGGAWVNRLTIEDESINYRFVIRKDDDSDLSGLIEEVSNKMIIYTQESIQKEVNDIKELTKILENSVNVTADSFVKAIAHRGYSSEAPENTLPAYKLAKEKGFKYVETDIQWTSDNEPVLLHDTSINRTSNGTGNISDLTLSEVKSYDFGSWKSSKYAGTKIPTFKEFIVYCKKLGLHPYVEVKFTDDTQLSILTDLVKKYQMEDKTTWISGMAKLEIINSEIPNARLAYITTPQTSTIAAAKNLQSDTNEVFLSVDYRNVTESIVEEAIASGVSIEVWTVNDKEIANNLVDIGVNGITTDELIIPDIFME